jgi:hypothetical protein
MSIENPRLPQRTFSADVGQYSIGTAGPDQMEYDFDNLFAMLDPQKTLRDGSQGGIGVENMQNMRIDHSQSPVSNQGNLEELLGRLANRIRAAMGSEDWKDDPAVSLADVQAVLDGLAIVVKKINNTSPDANGNFAIEAGTGITVSQGQNKVTITATGQATPGPHASSHASDGADPISPALIGAATAADINAHKGDASAHHTRYTDAEAVAAIKAADGSGSGIDADLLDGKHGSQYANVSHHHDGRDIDSPVAYAVHADDADTLSGAYATAFAEHIATVSTKRAGYAVYAP